MKGSHVGPVAAVPPPLDPQLVLGAYSVGVFPMADARQSGSVYWVEPQMRAILPLDHFHLSRSLRKRIGSDRFRVSVDTAFDAIIALCAQAAPDRPETWINPQIERAFLRLHDLGFAHSIEVWDGDSLAGGLYGLALGRAFFGESMVSRERDASKVALAWLVARLRIGGFTLLDCQFMTEHLASLGASEIPRKAYCRLLSAAIVGAIGRGGVAEPPSSSAGGADFFALDRVAPATLPDVPSATESGPPSGKVIAQLLGQMS